MNKQNINGSGKVHAIRNKNPVIGSMVINVHADGQFRKICRGSATTNMSAFIPALNQFIYDASYQDGEIIND